MAKLKPGDKAPEFEGINQDGQKITSNDFNGKKYMGVLRTTFIIDEEGVILEVIDKVKTKDHTNQIIQMLNL